MKCIGPGRLALSQTAKQYHKRPVGKHLGDIMCHATRSSTVTTRTAKQFSDPSELIPVRANGESVLGLGGNRDYESGRTQVFYCCKYLMESILKHIPRQPPTLDWSDQPPLSGYCDPLGRNLGLSKQTPAQPDGWQHFLPGKILRYLQDIPCNG